MSLCRCCVLAMLVMNDRGVQVTSGGSMLVMSDSSVQVMSGRGARVRRGVSMYKTEVK